MSAPLATVASMIGLIAGNSWGTDVGVEGFQSGPDVDDNSRYNQVGAGYFRTLGIPLLQGRDFSEQDTPESLPVMVVSRAP